MMLTTPALDAAVRLVLSSERLIAFTGAGISAESGIPTFRGKRGLWTERGTPPANRYRQFLEDSETFWHDELTRALDPWVAGLRRALEQARPNPAHVALAQLESQGALRAVITQNIDGLHQAAGSREVVEVHGSRHKMRCVDCGARTPRVALFLKSPPPPCAGCGGRVKFDSVLFGEPIPADVLRRARGLVDEADCVLVVGTSSTVRPAGGFPRIAKANGARLVEINTSETSLTRACDASLRGAAGDIVPRLVQAVRENVARRSNS